MGMTLTFYGYKKCATCRNAEKWLSGRGLAYEFVDITTNPPPLKILKLALAARDGKIGKLFNTSGEQYMALKIKDKLPSLSVNDALQLLASNGRLVKRPIVTDGKKVTVGFDAAEFARVWSG
jgi:arsenate reductase